VIVAARQAAEMVGLFKKNGVAVRLIIINWAVEIELELGATITLFKRESRNLFKDELEYLMDTIVARVLVDLDGCL
jgi:hypothetical protein